MQEAATTKPLKQEPISVPPVESSSPSPSSFPDENKNVTNNVIRSDPAPIKKRQQSEDVEIGIAANKRAKVKDEDEAFPEDKKKTYVPQYIALCDLSAYGFLSLFILLFLCEFLGISMRLWSVKRTCFSRI
jgi:hypothetical protein